MVPVRVTQSVLPVLAFPTAGIFPLCGHVTGNAGNVDTTPGFSRRGRAKTLQDPGLGSGSSSPHPTQQD